MLLFEVLDFCLCALAILGFVTQLVVPLIKGYPLFPLFRPKSAKELLREELERVKEEKEIARLQDELVQTHEENLQSFKRRMDRIQQASDDVLRNDPPSPGPADASPNQNQNQKRKLTN